MIQKSFKAFIAGIFLLLLAVVLPAQIAAQTDDPHPPARAVKLVFIHHSCGENWLSADDGDLGDQLGVNHYFVSDTNYGWGPDGIGDNTDIGQWWLWFRGPNSATYTRALYDNSEQNASYTRPMADPGGENEVILFKSCFPNSYLSGNPADSPTMGSNPLRGQDSGSEYMTVANAKGVYNDILAYFATRQDKLFVAITAPPLMSDDTDSAHAANARAFNNWLVHDWLQHYPYKNVAVFDFYNVLTSNGGTPYQNDAGQEKGNHHRWRQGSVQHSQTVASNVAAYADGDSHPTTAGNQKATDEFIPLLNVYYHRWQGDAPASTPTPTCTATNPPPTATKTSAPRFYLPMIWRK